jgi:hypothetical protein
MKKIKLALISLTIALAIGSAYATRPCDACMYSVQYVYSMGTYFEVGEHGYDYTCANGAGICTYYRPSPILQPNHYVPCRMGEYLIIP